MNLKQIFGSIAKAYRNYNIFLNGVVITVFTIVFFFLIISLSFSIGMYFIELFTGLIFIFYLLIVLIENDFMKKKVIYYLAFIIAGYVIYILSVYFFLNYQGGLFRKYPLTDINKILILLFGGCSAVCLALIIFAFARLKIFIRFVYIPLILNSLSIIPFIPGRDLILSIFFWQSSFSFYLYLIVKKAKAQINGNNIDKSVLQNIAS